MPEPEDPGGPAAGPSGSTTQQGIDVLLIDDDAILLDAMKLALEAEGIRVASAPNGEEALAILQSGPHPRILFLDLTMPVMDGWEFRRIQLDHAALARIPVLLISSPDRVLSDAASLRVAGYLTKPLDLDTLIRAARRYV